MLLRLVKLGVSNKVTAAWAMWYRYPFTRITSSPPEKI